MKPITVLCASLIMVAFLVFDARAQAPCGCPPGQDSSGAMSETTYVFRDGRGLGLCGSKNVDTRQITYSSFSLRECGKDSSLGFWNENKTCRIAFSRDTLFVQNIVNLPVGPGFNYLPVPLIVDKLYFSRGRVVRLTAPSPKFPKYSLTQSAAVVRKYESAAKPIVDDLEDVLNRLFMAAISGNRKAYGYLMDFAKVNPEMDADSQELYNEFLVMLGIFRLNR